MTTYYRLEYSGRAGGSFTEEGAFVTWNAGADSGFIITDLPNGTAGELFIALVGSSTAPDAADTLTQGAVTADVDTSNVLLYPAYLRDDVSVTDTAGDIDIAWTGPALGATHSFFADGATTAAIVGEILTFTNGAQCEVITVVDGVTPAVEYDVRFITNLDDENFPTDNESFTGDTAADGALNGEVYARAYSPLDMHRFLSLLNSSETIAGDDDLSIIDFTATDRSTDQIIQLLGTVTINDVVAQHMYGGSIDQGSGNTRTLYSGLNVQVTSPLSSTRPLLIKEDGIITDYWNNAYMPDSIQGNVRILVKTIENGVAIDGQRVKGKLLEFGELYFEAGTTLGLATTALALVSSGDSNNNTAVGTVAGYSPTFVEGFQTLDYGEGSGATPFGYSMDFDTNTSLESYEYTKYIQRRGTSELLFGRNAQLFTGININFAFDGEVGTLAEDSVLAYGTEVPYTGETAGPFVVGDVVEDTTTSARGRVIQVNDNGLTGTLILADTVGSFGNTNSLTTLRGSGETTATSGTVVNNARSGQLLLVAKGASDLYCQQLTGLAPADNQTLFQTDAITGDVNGTPETRTINNQYIGSYTGTNYQTNFGIAISTSDAIAGDAFPNLLGNTINPPDNRTGAVTNLVIGDYVTVYPWDGVATDVNGEAEPDFNEMVATTTITGGVSTSVVVGAGNIPANTPSSGFIRVERDSDGNYDLLEYSSFNNTTGTFTLVGTATSTCTTPFNVYRGLIDEVITSGTQLSYTAQFTVSNQVAITVRRGGSPDPIKTFKTTASFGGFSVQAVRVADA